MTKSDRLVNHVPVPAEQVTIFCYQVEVPNAYGDIGDKIGFNLESSVTPLWS